MNNKDKIYTVYKMVQVNHLAEDADDRHYSYNGIPTYTITYPLGKLAIAKVGELFCFKTLKCAKDYLVREFYNLNDACILQCETTCKPVQVYDMAHTTPSEIDRYWKGLLLELGRVKAPPGTYKVKSLTPVRVIVFKH